MSDIHNAPAGDSASAPIVSTPADESPLNSVSQAAKLLNAARRKQPQSQEPAPGAVNDAVRAAYAGHEAPAKELAEEANAAQPEQVDPGETNSEAEPAEQPPIEPPRSWTKEAKERWQSLPRETQDYLAQREQERDREVRRSQNETAEKLKGLTAKEQAVEQARQQYEAALPALLQTLQQQQQGSFADIKTAADVQQLATNDPTRFVQWQAQQMQIAAVADEAKRSQDRQSQEFETKWAAFAQEQDSKVAEYVPEISDPDKARKIADGGMALLKELGFSDQEIPQLWQGKASISLRDARIQRLLIDGVRYREAKAIVAKPAPKPVPPVSRPGVSKPAGAQDDAQIQALKTKLERTGSLKDAQALRAAELRSRRA